MLKIVSDFAISEMRVGIISYIEVYLLKLMVTTSKQRSHNKFVDEFLKYVPT